MLMIEQLSVTVRFITLYNVCSVHWGVGGGGGGGCSEHRWDIMMHVGDIMSTSGDVQYIGGIK